MAEIRSLYDGDLPQDRSVKEGVFPMPRTSFKEADFNWKLSQALERQLDIGHHVGDDPGAAATEKLAPCFCGLPLGT